MFAWPNPYFVELGVGVGREIGNLAFEPRLLSFGASKQIIVRLRHGTLLSSRAMGCRLTFARMRQPIRTVNRDKAHLLPVRNPFKAREAENYRVQDRTPRPFGWSHVTLVANCSYCAARHAGCVDIEDDARAAQLQ